MDAEAVKDLGRRLRAWMGGEAGVFSSFDEAALEVFRFQFERNLPYRRYCLARGVDAAALCAWQDIPAVPTDAFKFPVHRLAVFPPSERVRSFLTSGTTTEIRGVHEFASLALYETSVVRGWEELRLPALENPVFLSQSARDNPQSSLVWMFEVLARRSPGAPFLIDGTGRVDVAPLLAAAENGVPVQVFGTAIALLRLIERGGEIPLPPGSFIFETGGYKGLADAPDPAAFRGRLRGYFGIGEAAILNEYSMTELSSQFYRWGNESHHRGPRWTRVRVVNPETGELAAEGRAGYLEIVDLANLGSVCAIRTQDIAIARGDECFELIGRDPAALPRGCSRASDWLIR